MKAPIVIAVAAAAILAGCSGREFNAGAEQELPGPKQAQAYYLPQQYPQQQYPEQQQGGTYSPLSNHQIAVTYRGPSDSQLAWQTATNYCASHYGNSRVRLVGVDGTAGRAVFACDQL